MNNAKINIALMLIINLYCGHSYASFFNNMTAPQASGEVAFQAIASDIDNYKARNSSDDRKILNEYMGYFHSWYQSVTPPPEIFFNSLSPEAKKLVATIKKTAQQFEIAGGTIAGARRLSPEGEIFYQYVLQRLGANLP